MPKRSGRYVFDTNTLVSAILIRNSAPGDALRWVLREGTLLASPDTLDELSDALGRKKFDRYVTAEEREEFFHAFIERVELVEPTELLTVCRDPKDNKFLELAVEGSARVIVSGDHDLLILDPFGAIRTMTAAALLQG